MAPVRAGVGVTARIGATVAELVVQTGGVPARHVNVLPIGSHSVLLTRRPHLALTCE